MEIKDVETLYREIGNEFDTLVKVDIEDTETKKSVNLHFKSFEAENADTYIDLESRFNSIKDNFGEDPDPGPPMIEVFEVLTSYKNDQVDPENLVFLSRFLVHTSRLQLIFIPAEESVIAVLRSFVPIIDDRKTLKNELLLTIKDFLTYHYSINYEHILGSIFKTLDDKEMIDSLVKKHKNSINSLLNPVPSDDF